MYYGLWRFAKLPIIKAAMIQLSKHFQLNDAHLVNKFIFVAPPALPLPPVAETHTLLRKQLTYSGLATTYIISVLAASLAEIATGVIKEEGVLKLWTGITPALYRHVIYSGVRIVTYETLRDKFLQDDPNFEFPLWKSAAVGATAGAFAQFLASPADLVKVQIQMEGKRKLLGLEPRVKSTYHAFTKILTENGVRGLWKGSIPNVQRAALVNLGDLTTYDTTKRIILKNTSLTDNHITHVLSSACAGLVAATMGTPADVVKTRIMNQPTDNHGRGLLYKSSVDCLKKTIQDEGLFALYKGFLPIWIRMAPWSLTFWLSFEQIRHTMGVTAF
ncbi:hypothetical protein RUM44_011194 [Polyplax serrata]|uniref:Mitochondrial uncoupling protein 4 n=1 Tax=Polyplax serrata TaxID=468196 RepID=A0ABR1APD5_POLSC